MKLHHYYVYSNMDICQLRILTKVTYYRYSSGVYCPSFLPLVEEYLFFLCEFIVQNQVQFVNNLFYSFIFV